MARLAVLEAKLRRAGQILKSTQDIAHSQRISKVLDIEMERLVFMEYMLDMIIAGNFSALNDGIKAHMTIVQMVKMYQIAQTL